MAKLKVGVFGVRRGYDYIRALLSLNCEVVAICENREELRNEISKIIGSDIVAYDNFDDFIEHDMDAGVCRTCTCFRKQQINLYVGRKLSYDAI